MMDDYDPDRTDDELRAALERVARQQSVETIRFPREHFYEAVQHARPPRPWRRAMGWGFGIAGALVLLWGSAALSSHHRSTLSLSNRAQTALQKLPPPSSYRQVLVLKGQVGGFRSTMVASISPSDSPAYSLVTGYWVLTYVGEHPPVLNQYVLTGIADPGDVMIIAGQGDRQWLPKQVGRHRYLYWIVHWDHTQLTAFPPAESRRELQTSQITLRFADGGQTTLVGHQRPAVASPWNSPYWLRGNPPAINVHKPQLLFATVVAVRPGQVVLQYRWNRLVTATVWTTAPTSKAP